MRFYLFLLSTILISLAQAQTSHTHLKDKLDGSYVILTDYDLLFTVDEVYNVQGDLTYAIYDDLHAPIPATLSTLSVEQGNNRYSITNVHCLYNLTTGEFYILEVTGAKGHRQYLRFYLPYTTESCEGPGGPGL